MELTSAIVLILTRANKELVALSIIHESHKGMYC